MSARIHLTILPPTWRNEQYSKLFLRDLSQATAVLQTAGHWTAWPRYAN